jgi:hypothetical protein
LHIDAHRRGEGERGPIGNAGKLSNKLVNKNEMKSKIGDPQGNFVLKALTLRFLQKSELPPPLDFQ